MLNIFQCKLSDLFEVDFGHRTLGAFKGKIKIFDVSISTTAAKAELATKTKAAVILARGFIRENIFIFLTYSAGISIDLPFLLLKSSSIVSGCAVGFSKHPAEEE